MIGFLAFVGFAALVVLFFREVLVFGESRRSARLTPESYLRFRRRTKGMMVAGVLGGMLLGSSHADAAGRLVPQVLVGYYGICLILLIWLLLIAVRDFRATMTAAMDEQRSITLETWERVDELVKERVASEAPPEQNPPAPPPARSRQRGPDRRTHPGAQRRRR